MNINSKTTTKNPQEILVFFFSYSCIYGIFPARKELGIHFFFSSNLRPVQNWVQNYAQALTPSPWRYWPYGNLTPDKSENFYFAF